MYLAYLLPGERFTPLGFQLRSGFTADAQVHHLSQRSQSKHSFSLPGKQIQQQNVLLHGAWTAAKSMNRTLRRLTEKLLLQGAAKVIEDQPRIKEQSTTPRHKNLQPLHYTLSIRTYLMESQVAGTACPPAKKLRARVGSLGQCNFHQQQGHATPRHTKHKACRRNHRTTHATKILASMLKRRQLRFQLWRNESLIESNPQDKCRWLALPTGCPSQHVTNLRAGCGECRAIL